MQPPKPTYTVFLSNKSAPIGNANKNKDGGDLRQQAYDKMRALCPDNANSCDSTKKAEIGGILSAVGDEEREENLTFTIEDSQYGNTRNRDTMLAAAVASWQQASKKSCKEVSYHDGGEYGCDPNGDLRRSLTNSTGYLETRQSGAAGIAVPCQYKGTVCAAPDHITPVFGDAATPYSNHMNIGVSMKVDGDPAFDTFICNLIIDGLSELAMVLVPELAGLEITEEIELQALCDEMKG